MFTAFLLSSLIACFGFTQDQQDIEVGDYVRILRSESNKAREEARAASGSDRPRRDFGQNEDFEAYVVEISEDGRKIAYELITATGRRAGTISTKFVELIKKGRPARKSRTWTSASSGKTFEATLLEVKDDSVVLKKKGGKKTTAKISLFSEADRSYINRMKDASLERRVVSERSVVPFGKDRKPLATKNWSWKEHAVAGLTPEGTFTSVTLTAPVSIDKLGEIASDVNSGEFGTPSQSSFSANGPTGGRRGIGGPPGMPGRSGASRRRPSIAGGRGARGLSNRGFQFWASTFSDDGKTLFVLANQLEGQTSIVVSIDVASNSINFTERLDAFALAISPNGKQVALVQTGEDDQKGELILRRVGDEEIIKRFPLAAQNEVLGGFRIARASFIDDKTLITVGNEIVGVNVENGKGYATKRFPLGTMIEDFATSPNQKQIAVMSFVGTLVFDAARGKSIGSIAFPEGFAGDACAFSPSGKKLAVVGYGESLVYVYDMQTGKLLDSIAIGKVGFNKQMSWPDERFLLFGGRTLVDLELKTKVWEFEVLDGSDAGLVHLRKDWYLYTNANLEICPVQLPVANIRQRLTDFNADDALALGKGDSFGIDIDLPFSQAENDKIFQDLRSELEKRNFVYDEYSKNVFVCYVEDGKRETAKVRVGGTIRNPELEEVSWTTTFSGIELNVDGTVKWDKQITNSPNAFNIVRRGKESLDAAIARLASPSPRQFRGNSLPQQFYDFPGGDDVLGRSTVSTNGFSEKR